MLLPMSVGEIAYSKILGTAISLIPVGLVLFVGFVCAPRTVAEALGDFFVEPAAWYFVSQVVLFIHLATILSLYVKWGAVPLAFAGVYGGNMLMMIFAAMLFRFSPPDEGFLGVLAVFAIALCVGSHVLIGRRLQELAAR